MIGDIAHVLNRGVEKRKIFLDRDDYLRFVSNLALLNNKNGKLRTEKKNIFSNAASVLAKQDKLVEVLKWTLLPNHYHLLLLEKTEGGILEFTKRLGNAYTKSFNAKNEGRSGYLFQNSAKAVPMSDNRQMLYIPLYIDLNAVDMLLPDWKNNDAHDPIKAFQFIGSYPWSSLRNYFGSREFEEVISKELFFQTFDTSPILYEKELMGFLEDPSGIEIIDPSTWQVDGWRKRSKSVR